MKQIHFIIGGVCINFRTYILMGVNFLFTISKTKMMKPYLNSNLAKPDI